MFLYIIANANITVMCFYEVTFLRLFNFLVLSCHIDDCLCGVRLAHKLAVICVMFQGKTVRKKQELHRVCELNRAYAHFRW